VESDIVRVYLQEDKEPGLTPEQEKVREELLPVRKKHHLRNNI
jgi:hypothetical protein